MDAQWLCEVFWHDTAGLQALDQHLRDAIASAVQDDPVLRSRRSQLEVLSALRQAREDEMWGMPRQMVRESCMAALFGPRLHYDLEVQALQMPRPHSASHGGFSLLELLSLA